MREIMKKESACRNVPHLNSINCCVASPDLHALKEIVVQYEVQNLRTEAANHFLTSKLVKHCFIITLKGTKKMSALIYQ